ncbi:hypothetical protein RvY_19206, partial [Ramazzottius varieornatus]
LNETDDMISRIHDASKETEQQLSFELSAKVSNEVVVEAFHGYRYVDGQASHYFASFTK